MALNQNSKAESIGTSKHVPSKIPTPYAKSTGPPELIKNLSLKIYWFSKSVSAFIILSFAVSAPDASVFAL